MRQLENEVMRLQRELDAQSRRIEELERARARLSIGRSTSASASSRPAESSPGWLTLANWDRLKPGMKELEVIAVLGRPTSVRTEENGKVHALLYAMELGPDAVLAGNVRMGDAGCRRNQQTDLAMKLFTDRLLDELTDKANASPRRRAHHNIHHERCPTRYSASSWRPIGTPISAPTGTSPKSELAVVLRGGFELVTFDEAGRVLDRYAIGAGSGKRRVRGDGGNSAHAARSE